MRAIKKAAMKKKDETSDDEKNRWASFYSSRLPVSEALPKRVCTNLHFNLSST
jgi:hypothetical protein